MLVATAGCTGSSHPDGPTAAGLAARLQAIGPLRVDGHAARGTQRRPLTGTFASGARTGAVARADQPIDVGGDLVRVEVRRRRHQAWIRRAVVGEAGRASFGAGLLAVRSPGDPPWIAVSDPDRDPAARVVLAYDPIALLRRIDHAHIGRFTPAAAVTVGHGETAWQTELTRRQATALGLRVVTVTVDGDGTPVGVTWMTTTGLRVGYRIRRTRHAPTVTAPPAADVQAADRPLPDATGPYAPVATVTVAGSPITIDRAPARDDWSCWKVTSTPAYVTGGELRPSGGTCVAPITSSGAATDAFAIPLDTVDPSPYELVGILGPIGATGSARLADGTTAPLVGGPDGLLVYAGPVRPPAVLINVTLPSGATLVCGPGPISDAEDISRVTARDIETARNRAWNCQSPG